MVTRPHDRDTAAAPKVKASPQWSKSQSVIHGEVVKKPPVKQITFHFILLHNIGQLSPNDLRRVQDTIWEARAKWYNLGLGLDITPDTLDTIKLDNASTNDCFRAMLTKWLREYQRPTWSALAEALRSPSVELTHLAEEISKLEKLEQQLYLVLSSEVKNS